ncbi:MAG: hypothetical protein ACLVGP_02540 [Oscillospiraceae bacterium]
MARKKRFSGESNLKPWLTDKAPGSKTNGRFIQVGNSLLMNKQFQALSTGAKYLYFCMAMEAGAQNDFAFPKGVAARKYGIATTSFERHRRELESAGFICILNSPSDSEPKAQFAANRFRFSFEKWRDGTTPRNPPL